MPGPNAGISSVKSNDGTSKICSQCDKRKPLDQFYNWSKGDDGKQAACKVCQNSRLQKIRENTVEERKQYQWEHNLKKKYGIDAAKYAEMLFLQGGVVLFANKIALQGTSYL